MFLRGGIEASNLYSAAVLLISCAYYFVYNLVKSHTLCMLLSTLINQPTGEEGQTFIMGLNFCIYFGCMFS